MKSIKGILIFFVSLIIAAVLVVVSLQLIGLNVLPAMEQWVGIKSPASASASAKSQLTTQIKALQNTKLQLTKTNSAMTSEVHLLTNELKEDTQKIDSLQKQLAKNQTQQVSQQAESKQEANILAQMEPTQAVAILGTMSTKEASEVIAQMAPSDSATILEAMSPSRASAIVAMSAQEPSSNSTNP